MSHIKMATKFMTGIFLNALLALSSPAQSQPDSQAGAQLGEQSALAGRQAQGADAAKGADTSRSGATRFVAGTLINSELTGSLDSKKLNQGDAVNARVADDIKSTDGRIILPRGTKITGHVTKASARSAGQPDSSLGLFFDKAVLKNGEEITLNAGIQAVGTPESQASSQDMTQLPESEPLGGSARGPGNGGVGIAPGSGSTTGPPSGSIGGKNTGAAPNITKDPNDAGQWNSNTRGVVGLRNLSLSAASGSGTEGSVIASTGKNVHLDNGTRLILVTTDVKPAQSNGQNR
jgi:hypothetical protein